MRIIGVYRRLQPKRRNHVKWAVELPYALSKKRKRVLGQIPHQFLPPHLLIAIPKEFGELFCNLLMQTFGRKFQKISTTPFDDALLFKIKCKKKKRLRYLSKLNSPFTKTMYLYFHLPNSFTNPLSNFVYRRFSSVCS